jgi:hypothetical protein
VTLNTEKRRPTDRTALSTTLDSILPRKVGASVETELDQALWKLTAGDLQLHDLTPALQGWYSIAHSDGYAAGYNASNDSLRFDRDRWYFVACNPGKKPGDFYPYLTDLLWQEAVA